MDKELEQSDLNQLVKLVTELVYYSQIHTVKGVQPANMQSHDESWREAQQWLWNNCKPIEGEYFLKTEMTTSSRVKKLENELERLRGLQSAEVDKLYKQRCALLNSKKIFEEDNERKDKLLQSAENRVKELEDGLKTLITEYEFACKIIADACKQVYSENSVTISAKQLLTNKSK